MRILSLCDHTGNMVRPWAEAGHECWCVDLQNDTHNEENIHWIGEDLHVWVPPLQRYDMVFAFPPCTDMAVSGARWFRSKGLNAIGNALLLVDRCRRICEASGAPWMLENPVSTLATYWREPDDYFHPYEYAGYLDDPEEEAYTKKTCLWTGGGFFLPLRKPVEPTLGSMMHRLPPSDERANLRSATPRGFARAVFEMYDRSKNAGHVTARLEAMAP